MQGRIPQNASVPDEHQGLTEDEAISLMSIAVDFGITQVVDGNWGVHTVIKKSIFAGAVVA
jgi:acetamidase/formamidase